MSEYKLSSHAIAPRWANLPSFLKDLAHYEGDNVKLSMEVEKGWVFDKIRFTFESDNLSSLNNIESKFRDTVDGYNER